VKALLPLTRGVKPCVTSTGVQIGVNYIPPHANQQTAEESFWQEVLLGIEPEWSQRRVLRAAAYLVFVLAIVLATFWKAKEVSA
jgi:hypothetical protein